MDSGARALTSLHHLVGAGEVHSCGWGTSLSWSPPGGPELDLLPGPHKSFASICSVYGECILYTAQGQGQLPMGLLYRASLGPIQHCDEKETNL